MCFVYEKSKGFSTVMNMITKSTRECSHADTAESIILAMQVIKLENIGGEMAEWE